MTKARGPLAEAWLLTGALVRNRALAVRRDWKSRSLYGFAVALAVGVFAFIFLGTFAGVRVLTAASAGGLIDSLPAWAFLVYLFTDILIAFGQALGDLYLSRDMPILMSMPLRTSSIVIAKFVLGVAQNELYVGIFLLPFALAYLAGMGAAWWAYPLAAAAVLTFPATLYAPLIILTVAALRFIPARVAKEGLWVVGASVPTVFWFLSFYRVAHITGDVASMRLPDTPAWLPSTWIGVGLSRLAQGDAGTGLAWLGVLALATFVICPLALVAVSRGFTQGWSAAGSAQTRKRAPASARRPQTTPVRALARKDAITFLRSPQLWFNHLTAIAFVVFLLIGHDVQTPLLPLTPQLALIQAGFVAVFGALNPGMTALSLEHLSVWVIRSAPLNAAQILTSKALVACGQAAAIAVIGALGLAAGYRLAPAVWPAIVLFALASSIGSICVGIAFDAAYPSFAWENPNTINRGLRMVIPFLTNIAVLGACAVFYAIARIGIGSGVAGVYAGLAPSLLLQAVVATGALRAARRDIEALEV